MDTRLRPRGKMDTKQDPELERGSIKVEEKNLEKPWAGYKYLACIVLCLQNATLVLVLRHTRTRTRGDMYVASTAVVMAEVFKELFCLGVLFKEEGWSLSRWLKHLHENIIQDPWDTLKLAVPAGIYTLQNNLLFVAVSNLDAATFQVTFQLKILTTAIFSVTTLGKTLTKHHWLSLVILFAGVCMVQLQKIGLSSSSSSSSSTSQTPVDSGQNQLLGLVAVVISCISSGFAGVYFEKILKGRKGTIWLRNIQLSFFGVLFGLAGMWANDGQKVMEKGFFVGYDGWVWFIISFQAFGGLMVAVVVKYADNILKGFATSAAIILSCVASVFLFDYVITLQFAFGAFLVILSVYMYGKADANTKN